MRNLPNYVEITEVGPRDGIQNEKDIIPTEKKLEFIHALNQVGFKRIEAMSFVSPKHVPQMADAPEVADMMKKHEDTQYIALIPNYKGYELAQRHHMNAINIVVAVSETFNQKNVRMSREASMEHAEKIIRDAKAKNIFVRFSLATSFWCPFDGKINEDDVLKMVGTVDEWGVDEFDICDTIGRADPVHVYSLFSKLVKNLNLKAKITAHFHDTYGFGQVNVMAALQAGVTSFDAAAGGMGGCPFAPGAAGNLATEDLVFLLNSIGVETNIDLIKLKDAVDLVKTMTTRNLSGHIHQLI